MEINTEKHECIFVTYNGVSMQLTEEEFENFLDMNGLTRTDQPSPRYDFPIAKIDRFTAQKLMPILMNKDIFAGFKTLRLRADILYEKKRALNKAKLSLEEEREALAGVGRYIADGYVIRDFYNYTIGFSVEKYANYLEMVGSLRSNGGSCPLFPKEMQKELESIRLYKLAQKIMYFLLTEVYRQRSVEVVITKQQMLAALGYASTEKQIYGDIKTVLNSLRGLEYLLHEFETTTEKKVLKTGNEKGNFIYNIKERGKDMVVSMNKYFIGCIQQLAQLEGMVPNEEIDFGRGYFNFPSRILALSKDYSDAAYNLTQFFLRENGNQHIKEHGYKIIAKKIETYIEIAGLRYNRPDKNLKSLVKALKEIEIVEKSEPTLSQLEKMKPQRMTGLVLRIWITGPVDKLDERIQAKLEQKENGKKGKSLKKRP